MIYKNEKLTHHIEWFKDKHYLKTSVLAISCLFVVMLVVSCFVDLKSANASVESNLSASTASTKVYLQTDTSQLKFTAPTSINFMLDGNGDFEYPTNITFTNDSVMDLQVSGYTVTSENGSKGVEDADDSQYSATQDVYSVKVSPTHSGTASTNKYVFSKSWTESSSSNEDWIVSTTEKSIGLTFSDGRMPHPGRQWVESDKQLQTVVWSVTAATSSK